MELQEHLSQKTETFAQDSEALPPQVFRSSSFQRPGCILGTVFCGFRSTARLDLRSQVTQFQ